VPWCKYPFARHPGRQRPAWSRLLRTSPCLHGSSGGDLLRAPCAPWWVRGHQGAHLSRRDGHAPEGAHARRPTTLASPCRRASPEFPSRHHDVVLRGALVTVSGGYHHTCCRDAVRAYRGRRRASLRRRAALPPPQWTHGGSHPASTFGDPLAQEVRQPSRVMLPTIWVGTAIDRDRRHTPAGATLPHGSVPLQGMPVMIEEHMATHRSLSSPWRSCTTAHNHHTDDLALFLALRQLASVTQRQREHQENTAERSLRSRRFSFQIKRPFFPVNSFSFFWFFSVTISMIKCVITFSSEYRW
jgi:hypothetical protein